MATPSMLWPPDHKMVNVAIGYAVTDNCDPAPAITCGLGVASNEPIDGTGDGDTAPDWIVVDTHHVQLRSERAGNGNGRVYTVTVGCKDSKNNASSATTAVGVPHNR